MTRVDLPRKRPPLTGNDRGRWVQSPTNPLVRTWAAA